MKLHRGFLFGLAITLVMPLHGSSIRRAMVIVPVADVRKIPEPPQPGVPDNNQETQLLFGEEVTILESSGTYYRIQVLDQLEYSHHNQWEGYPGWVLQTDVKEHYRPKLLSGIVTQKWLPLLDSPQGTSIDQLPLGAILFLTGAERKGYSAIALSNSTIGWVRSSGFRKTTTSTEVGLKRREAILKTAALMLGDPYVWGGRSPFDDTGKITLSGLDCSGLVNLSYHVNGVEIPRDALEQYMKSIPLENNQLLPGDLIFLASIADPKRITHVMLYQGGENIIEAPQTGFTVHNTTFQEKLGKPLKELHNGIHLTERVVYFGRLLED